MVEIKKQVVESSKKSFRPFKIAQTSTSKPCNVISNVELDEDDDEEEIIMSAEDSQDEEFVEVHGL